MWSCSSNRSRCFTRSAVCVMESGESHTCLRFVTKGNWSRVCSWVVSFTLTRSVFCHRLCPITLTPSAFSICRIYRGLMGRSVDADACDEPENDGKGNGRDEPRNKESPSCQKDRCDRYSLPHTYTSAAETHRASWQTMILSLKTDRKACRFVVTSLILLAIGLQRYIIFC